MPPLEPAPDEDAITCNACGHLADDHDVAEPFACQDAGEAGAGCACEGLDLGSPFDEDEEAGDE